MLTIVLTIASAALLLDAIVTWKAYRLSREKKIQILERRLEDYRGAANVPNVGFCMFPVKEHAWKVAKLYYGSTGPIYINIREFNDEDEEFNQREAEELLNTLNQK